MQRLTALGELVSTTTHEFNNVLMTTLNYAKMGVRHKDDETRDKSFTMQNIQRHLPVPVTLLVAWILYFMLLAISFERDRFCKPLLLPAEELIDQLFSRLNYLVHKS